MSTTNVNSVVAAAETATTENGTQVANTAAEAQTTQTAQVAETIDAIVARLCRDGKSKVVKTAITAVDVEERTAKNGSKYLNAFVNLETPVIGSQKSEFNRFVGILFKQVVQKQTVAQGFTHLLPVDLDKSVVRPIFNELFARQSFRS